MEITEVKSSAQEDQFFNMTSFIYKDDSNYISPLRNDIDDVFSSKNKSYKPETTKRFLVTNQGQIVGRIAAFVNSKTVNAEKIKVGGLGFYECIDDINVSKLLFDTALNWLESLGIQAVDGPINLGERDKYWGCLVYNFESIPSYNQAYGRPYYSNHFEAYGFQDYFQQFVFHRDLNVPAQPIFVRKYNQVMKDSSYRVATVEGRSIEQIASDFVEVYNNAWGGSYKNFKPMKLANATKMIKSMKPIMDPRIILFVYKDDKPIAFYINIPELNEIFKFVGKKLNLVGKLKFLYYKKTIKPQIMVGLIFGVVKDFQGQGIEGVMIKWMEDNVKPRFSYQSTTLNWIGDFNPKMLKVTERLDSTLHRKFITYRYMIDKSIEFQRHPVVG
ncbi:MAG: hypothetical protein ACPG6V_05535 [Flavobacteriales bacterium]